MGKCLKSKSVFDRPTHVLSEDEAGASVIHSEEGAQLNKMLTRMNNNLKRHWLRAES